MNSKEIYELAYQDGIDTMKEVINYAVKRNRGARTTTDCINALNDIILAMHQDYETPKHQIVMIRKEVL